LRRSNPLRILAVSVWTVVHSDGFPKTGTVRA
jgi:hypothetical protein